MSRSRVDSLDGLRTIAVLLVVAFHVGVPGFAGGYLGVDVFFVLSGFLITTLLVKELGATGRIDLGRFWSRRALRLMPASLLVVLAVVVWALFVAPPYRRPGIGADALWSLLYVGNWRFIGSAGYFSDDGTSSPLLHVWSLAVEEQFYLAWPLVLTVVATLVRQRVGRRHRGVVDSATRLEGERRRRRVVAVATGCTALVLAAASAVWLHALYDPAAPERAYMGTDTKVFEPLIGAVAAALLTRERVQRLVVRHHATLMAGGLAGLGIGVATLGGPSPLYFGGGAVAFSICCAVLVAAATAGGNGHLVARTLGLPPLAYVGRISYGVYLWHWPLTVWILGDHTGFEPWRALLVVVLTLAVASVSYHVVELPLRTGGLTRITPLQLLPVGVGTLAASVVISTALGGTALSRFNPLTEHMAASMASSGARQDTMVVVGDSVMRRLTPTLATEAAARGITVLDAARGGCPALTVPALAPDGTLLAKGACTDKVRAAQDEAVAQHRPGTVLWWSRYELADRRGDDGRLLRAGTPEFWAAQRASFVADAARLTSHGARLVVVLTDRPGIGLASRCTPDRCDPFLHRLWYDDELRRTWNTLVTEVAADDPRIETIALDDVFCRDDAVPCDDRLPLDASGLPRDHTPPGAGAAAAAPSSAPGSTPGSGITPASRGSVSSGRPPAAAHAVPRTRSRVDAAELTGLARPDGSHFSPEAAPAVCTALLDRVAAAVRG